ncbi:MAG TPA: LacI family DNA-binding transcriptional regulator [Chthoniobacterales bacterium]
MIDVARLAGVSHQTVSRVVNGNPNVTPELITRVQHAVKQLGYRRNTAARALSTGQTMNLGVVSFDIWQYGPTHVLFGVADAARQFGYATSLVSLGNTDRKSVRAAIEHLVGDSVDGIIVIAPVEGAKAAVQAAPAHVPLVMFEPGVNNGTTCVAIDEVHGARLATRHMLELGHESVWHVSGPPGWLGTEARIRGWRSELTAAKRVAHDVIVGDWSAASGYRAGKEIARNRQITAVFVANDQMALGVLQALQQSGLTVPRDVSVTGFDDLPESGFFQPSLTTIRLDFTEIGRRCVQRLLEMIRGTPPTPTLPLPPQLVVRSSTGAAPVGKQGVNPRRGRAR